MPKTNTIVEQGEVEGTVLGLGNERGYIKIKKQNGEWRDMQRERYERIRQVAEYKAKNYSRPEIHKQLKNDGYDVSQSVVSSDLAIINELDTYPLDENTLRKSTSSFIRSAQMAKERFWKISDKEYSEEDGNPFAAIKAAKHAYEVDKAILKTLTDIGFKFEELKKGEGGSTSVDEGDLDDKIEEKLSAAGLNVEDLVD